MGDRVARLERKWIEEIDKALARGSEKRLFNELVNVYAKLRGMKKRHFDRYLPFGEYFGDRWSRAQEYGFGEGSSIYDSAIVLGKVGIGENTWIGPNVLLDGSGGLAIGDNCSISAGVQIYSHDSVAWAVTGGKKGYEYAATKIGHRCYIGPNVIIQKGITVGNGVIIGANSFVNKDVEDGQTVAGSPARVINDARID